MRSLVSLFLILLTFVPSLLAQQPGMRKMQLSSEDAFLLGEVGAVIADQKGTFKVMMVAPREGRAKGSEDADLRQGDEVIMVNGKRISKAKDLHEAYDGLAIGGDLRLGIRRGEEKMIVAIRKADPKEMPRRQMITMGGGMEGLEAFPALGLLLRDGKDSAVIARVLPEGAKEVLAAVKEGDQLLSINGTSLRSVKAFSAAWDGLKQGDAVTLQLSRTGKAYDVSFKKPKPAGGMIRMRQ